MKSPQPGKRYITKAGFERLREQFRVLLYEQRPRVTQEVAVAAAHGDRSENYEYKLGKRKLREIDAQIHRLQKMLESFEVVDPAARARAPGQGRGRHRAGPAAGGRDGADHREGRMEMR